MRTALILCFCCLLAGPVLAEESAGADAKQAFHATNRAIGHTVHKTTRAIGHGTRKAAHAVGHGVHATTRAIGHGFRDAAHAVTGKDR